MTSSRLAVRVTKNSGQTGGELSLSECFQVEVTTLRIVDSDTRRRNYQNTCYKLYVFLFFLI